ncbi:hypothetical protein [Telluribacter sp.]|jgi:hypothetical protein|uniref:hypothetical protein n=1 Tax=Telluribacter sp. TaxID=1978767 RepID=UPI002E102F56|nr:hypothetical protein [Telluribacter sp.]
MKFFFYLVLLLVPGIQAIGQTSDASWYITANGNLFLPSQSSGRGTYPILWYDSSTEPKLLIGGIGAGVTKIQPLGKTNSLRLQANLSRHTYWDESLPVTTPQGIIIGPFYRGGSDFCIGLTGTAHHNLSERFSVGTGLGVQALLVSLSRLPAYQDRSLGHVQGVIGVNNHYKRLQPVVPVELSLKLSKLLFTIRYEYGLLNSLKGDLSKYKTDKYSLLVFETGILL